MSLCLEVKPLPTTFQCSNGIVYFQQQILIEIFSKIILPSTDLNSVNLIIYNLSNITIV